MEHFQDLYAKKREGMILEQLEPRGIDDQEVLNAIKQVKREYFVPDSLKSFAYADRPLPIGYGQTISQPYIVALMTQAAHVQKTDKVLEVGAGSGYQAAVLGYLAKEVYSLETVIPLSSYAQKNIEKQGLKNIKILVGDGYEGLKEESPFDVILVTAAPPEIPKKLLSQLAEGGRMIIPVGETFDQKLLQITRKDNHYISKEILSVMFVPMVHGKVI
jgi:protein-L-isoaspartate(D-aspartate) O-methyltransferase